MDENKTAATADSAEEEAIREDFNGPYSTRVHRIGRTTLCIALVLSFLPVFYMYFVKGWQVAGYYYVTVAATLFALCIRCARVSYIAETVCMDAACDQNRQKHSERSEQELSETEVITDQSPHNQCCADDSTDQREKSERINFCN